MCQLFEFGKSRILLERLNLNPIFLINLLRRFGFHRLEFEQICVPSGHLVPKEILVFFFSPTVRTVVRVIPIQKEPKPSRFNRLITISDASADFDRKLSRRNFYVLISASKADHL